jgi:hypothetical protein
MSADVIALDVLSNSDVFLRGNRICARSGSPQRSAGLALRALGVKDCTIHFRKWGRIVRAVQLAKLLREDTAP